MNNQKKKMIFLFLGFHILHVFSFIENGGTGFITESLPVGDFELSSMDSVPSTWEALVNLLKNTNQTVDVTAMYWNLLGGEDRKIFDNSTMTRFGADRGTAVYNAFEDALSRGVKIRLLLSKWNGKGGFSELERLRTLHPKNLEVRSWDATRWYGGGILHQKLWVFDKKGFYLGSANMDWKSLAQVMEVGVVIQNNKETVMDMAHLFDSWWYWSSPDFQVSTAHYFSNTFQVQLKVPAWSSFLPDKIRAKNPFNMKNLSSNYNMTHPLSTSIGNVQSNLFISGSPKEILCSSRTFDEDSLKYTILSAEKTISLSVMDFEASSKYRIKGLNSPISWRALEDSFLSVYFAKRIHIRILISRWAHTSPEMIEGLKNFLKTASLCKKLQPKCKGTMEIRLFEVPGWNNTVNNDKPAKWPSFSRVNHAKYIVTDHRVNIGTSNMLWDYFYTTGGISFNTNHEILRTTTQQIFDRNWNSSYSKPLHFNDFHFYAIE